MSLQVWLPLNKEGNLQNLGLDNNISVTNVLYNSNGKLGGCYASGGYICNWGSNHISNGVSVCFWHKWSGSVPTGWVTTLLFPYDSGDKRYYLATNEGHFYMAYREAGYLTKFTLDANWHHIAMTVSDDGTSMKIYIDGQYDGAITGRGSFNLGGNLWMGSSYLNDVRIYSHCLSPKEVKEISKGLVLHYPMDEEINLVKNGFRGLENWSGLNNSTDVPNSTCEYSHYGSPVCNQMFQIDNTHTYYYQTYLKKYGSNSYCYTTIYPYDIDKKFINYYNEPEGFRSASLTYLTQPLNTGDTVLYLNDVSGWSTTDTHGYMAAIFGYEDSTGYIYPDMKYTLDVPAFGTTTDKSNIDFENNTITLRSAFTGKSRPAGTKVCLTVAGSTYYYKWSGKSTNYEDWVLHSGEIDVFATSRLRYSRYWRVGALYAYCAGLMVYDKTAHPNGPIIHDCSGYGNDGIISGSVIIQENNTPKYLTSSKIDLNCKITPTINLDLDSFSYGGWFKINTLVDQTWKPLINLGSSGYFYYAQSTRYKYEGRGQLLSLYIPMTEWNHIMIVVDKANEKSYAYINGVKLYEWSGEISDVNISKFEIFGGVDYSLSDIRLYSTALSLEDIQELYNVGAAIDNQGDLLCHELNEEDENIFKPEYLAETAKNTSLLLWQIREDEYCLPLDASHFYFGSGDSRNSKLLSGHFLANTRYKFNMWINYDNVVSGGENKMGGLIVYYSDGTSSLDLCDTGSSTNKKGYQHKVLITPAGKTVSTLGVYYYTSNPAYYRIDSTIVPLKDDIEICKSGVVNTPQIQSLNIDLNIYKNQDMTDLSVVYGKCTKTVNPGYVHYQYSEYTDDTKSTERSFNMGIVATQGNVGNIVAGHKYFISARLRGCKPDLFKLVHSSFAYSVVASSSLDILTSFTKVSKIVTCSTSSSYTLNKVGISTYLTPSGGYVDIDTNYGFKCYDLTALGLESKLTTVLQCEDYFFKQNAEFYEDKIKANQLIEI